MKKILTSLAALLLISGAAYYFWADPAGTPAGEASSARLEDGIERFEQKQYPEALAQLQPLADAGSENWRTWYYLGSTQMMMKDYPAAAAALEQSLALRPEEPGTLYALGVVYYKQGNLKLAKAYFQSVLEINPNDQHARGLMDIMTRLEQNPADAPEETAAEPAEHPENGS